MKQHGFSLAEALVAAGLLGVVVAGVTTLVSTNSTQDVLKGRIQSGSACVVEANRILSNVKERGLVRSRFNYPVPAAPTYPLTVTAYTGEFAGAEETGFTAAERWGLLNVYGTPAAGIIPLRPHTQIMGYMNALQALYNSAPATWCPSTGPGGTANPFLNGVTGNIGLKDATVYMKINTYNTTTGVLNACSGATVDVRPARSTTTSIATMAMNPPGLVSTTTPAGAQNHPNVASTAVFSVPTGPAPVDTTGFAVTITVRHNDRNDTERECSVQEKFQYSVQPTNSAVLEFEDMDNASNSVPGSDGLTGDPNPAAPEMINGTVRMPRAAPRYTTTTVDTRVPTDTMIYGCGATDYAQNIRLRLKNVRPGSIMMCRNLSYLRQAPAGFGTGVKSMTLGFPQRTTFYSTELMQHEYFANLDTPDGVPGDLMIAGLYYPYNVQSSTYYCRTADGCNDLPRFGGGYAGNSPAGNFALDVTGTQYYRPNSNNAYGAVAANGTWEPCETVNVCGSGTPDFARFVPGGGTAADAYHWRKNNLPVGCEVHIQMAEVDAGYQVKATTFREYIHERAPGNFLCRSGSSAPVAGHLNQEWYFACAPHTSPPSPICAGGPAGAAQHTTSCCIPFPFFPHYRPTVDP